MNEPTTQKTGRIIEWDHRKGFGFLHDGTHRIFIHSRDFAEHRKVPERGDTVTFSVGEDFTGRTCAKQAVITSSAGRVSRKHFVILFILLVAPGFAIYRLSQHFDALLLIGTAVLLSVATYFIYAWDKHRAQSGGRRTSESTLHLCELLGGWPGAFLAQRRLRHKSSKISYLVLFWIIVVAHQYLAIDYSLNWRIARTLGAAIQPPEPAPAPPTISES